MADTRLVISKAGRRNLKDICREFDRCSRNYPALYHQRMVPWSEKGRVGITLSQWEAFRHAEFAQLDDKVWSQWDEPSRDDDYLGLWFGNGEGLAEFVDLSESVAMVLSQENLEFDPLDFNCDIRHGSDWIQQLHDWAFKYQMPLLRSDMGLWGGDDCDLEDFYELAEEWYTLEDGTKIPRHPVMWRLIDNVFTSSMAAIRAILAPDTVIATNEPWPLCLESAGFDSAIIDSPPLSTEKQLASPDDSYHYHKATVPETVNDECEGESQAEAKDDGDNPDTETCREIRVSCSGHQLIEEELFWSIRYAETGKHFRFKDNVGFKYIAMLLRSSGVRVNPVDAYRLHGRKSLKLRSTANRFGTEHQNDAAIHLRVTNSLDIDDPVLDTEADEKARQEYDQLSALLERAKLDGGQEAIKEFEDKIAKLKKWFINDHDKDGNVRFFRRLEWENCRKAVTNAIDRTLDKIEIKSKAVAQELRIQIDRKHGFCFHHEKRFPEWNLIEKSSNS